MGYEHGDLICRWCRRWVNGDTRDTHEDRCLNALQSRVRAGFDRYRETCRRELEKRIAVWRSIPGKGWPGKDTARAAA